MNKNKMYKWILSVLAVVILISCTLEEPVLPQWLVQWRIPFSTSFTIDEALDDPNFIIDTTSTGQERIAISIVDSSEKKSVSISDLAIKPDPDHAGANIDQLSLGTLGPISSNTISISDILGVPVFEGLPISIPDTSVQVDLVYLLYVDINSAHIKNGIFRLEFVNNTFLNIRSGMQIDIFDDSTDVPIGTANFPQAIPSMGSAFADPDMDLADKDIHTRFLLQIQMPIEAINRTLSAADVAGTAWINGTLIDLDVYSAEAIFPAQTINVRDSTSIVDQDHRIRVAEVDNGRIELTIENQLDVTANVWVKLLNFTDIASGEPISEEITIPAGLTFPRTIVVDSARIADYPDPNSGNLIDYMYYEVDVITDSSAGYVTITENDSVLVDVVPDSLFFRMIDGQVDMIEIPIDPVIKDDLEDLSRIDGRIYLDSLQMNIDLYNQTGLPIDITLNISGSDDTEEVILAPIHAQIPSIDQGGYLRLRLDAFDPHPNIIDLIGILPNVIILEAEAFVDGDGHVAVGQEVWANYQIFSPLYLRIAQESSITSDVMEEELDQEVRDKLENNVRSTEIYLDVYNGLPIGAQASVYVSHDSTNLFEDTIVDSSTKFIIPDLIIAAGEVDGQGYVDEPAVEQIIVELTREHLQVFYTTDIVYIGTKTTLPETEGLVKLRPKDKIELTGFFGFQFLIDE